MLEFFQALHWGAVFQIILIDILLGGDNAVVIALACRNLEKKQRMQGILWGTAGAIILRVILIAFALTLLQIPFLKLVGGALLVWIGIAGAAQNTVDHHQIYYVIFGLVVSVPIIVWGSTLVLKLIDRFPVVILLGAGLLGWIAGGMLVTDIFIEEKFGVLPGSVKIAAEVIGALFVVALGKWLGNRKTSKAEANGA